jgi:hypothetical protein
MANSNNYHIPFTASIFSGTQPLYQDQNDGIKYNPSTKVLTVNSNTSTQWTSAYNWGNHANAGYLTSAPVSSVNTKTGAVVLSTTDISEGTRLYYTDARARASLSGSTGITYNSTTGAISVDTTSIATQAYVGTQIANLVATAPATLDTLKELADALGDDPNFATTMTTALGTKLATADFNSTFDTRLAIKSTTNLAEGTNLYYTDTRSRSAISGGTGLSYNSTTGVLTNTITQYTDTLARAALSGSTGVTYNSSTGAISIGQAVGTTADVTFNTVDANITDGNYIVGQMIASRNTSWTPPSSGLTTVTGTNGISVGSTTGYSPALSTTYYAGDTTAGTNTSAAIIGRGASGTNTSPTAASSGQVLATFNADGYATSGWAQAIATTGSGAGTTALSPAQLQFYTREAFADSAGTVTNAGTAMRVRMFNTATAMSSANRVSIIDHSTATATYKAATFNIQPASSTANYASFTATGHTIGGVDSPVAVQRSRATGGISPSFLIQNYRSDQTIPANNDGTSFRSRVLGSNNTTYTISDISSIYNSSTGDHSVNIAIASGDQTGATLTSVTTISSKPTQTTISAGTAGSSAAVSPKITVDANKVTMGAPVAYPSYTTTQRDALTPSAGWVLWNSTLTKLQVYTGSGWADLN